MKGYCYRSEKQYRQGKKHRGKHNKTPKGRDLPPKELTLAMSEVNPQMVVAIPIPNSQTTVMEAQ